MSEVKIFIKDQTLRSIHDQLAARNAQWNQLVQADANDDWQKVQANVKAGKARALYNVGDEFITHYTLGGTVYDMPWVVLDNDRECEWADGTKHPGLWLGMKYCSIEDIQFDAAENTVVDLTEEPNALEGWYYWGKTGSTYTALELEAGDAIPTTYDTVHKCGINNRSVLTDGYNRWSHSGQRQWLNSAAPAGEWWEAQHLGDKAPSQLATRAGFMAGLDADFLAIVNPVKIKTACNTVTDGGVIDTTVDKFFLQSVEEVYGAPQLADAEGPYFPYWKDITGLDEPSNATNEARKIRRINAPTGSAAHVRLRSAIRANSNYQWIVYSGGYLTNHNASTSCAALAACVIS